MKAMLFAAGLGTRLGSYTKNAPKALIQIAGKSVLSHNIGKLHNSGFTEIIVNVHHHPDLVINEIDKLNSEGYSVTVSDERELLLDTGGGLFKAKWFFGNEPFLLYNTDIISSIDLTELYRHHMASGAVATLAVRKRKGNRFLLAGSDGYLKGWSNRATGEIIKPVKDALCTEDVGFSGIHIVSPEIFNYMHEGIYSLTTLYLKIAEAREISLFRHDEDTWWDMGTPEILSDLRQHFSGY
jgi:NDP-sugar pyrophosphorylase family protein